MAEEAAVKNGSVIHPDTLTMLCRVMDDSCESIIAARPALSAGGQDDLRIWVAQVVMAAFDQGVVDPEKLKQIVVNKIAPQPMDNG